MTANCTWMPSAPWRTSRSPSARRLFCFFSSRRRHTRCSRDWSSDVCSSDLPYQAQLRILHHFRAIFCCRMQRSEEHTSELQSRLHLVCRLLLEKKKKPITQITILPTSSLIPILHTSHNTQ